MTRWDPSTITRTASIWKYGVGWAGGSLTDLVLFLRVADLFISDHILPLPQPVAPDTTLLLLDCYDGEELVKEVWVGQ